MMAPWHRGRLTRPKVRCGSKADLTAPKSNFRFTPQSRLRADIAPCPFRATSGLMRRSKRSVIRSHARHASNTGGMVKPKRLRGRKIDDKLEFGACSTGRLAGRGRS
jgi:hypothetical protein